MEARSGPQSGVLLPVFGPLRASAYVSACSIPVLFGLAFATGGPGAVPMRTKMRRRRGKAGRGRGHRVLSTHRADGGTARRGTAA